MKTGTEPHVKPDTESYVKPDTEPYLKPDAEQPAKENKIGKSIWKGKDGIYSRFGKRPFDILLSAAAIILLSPVLLVVAALVRVDMGSPVFFRQKRLGMGEKEFRLYKFRTMTDQRDEKGELLPDDRRITKLGYFLRNTSLDEIPEIINILKGDMSIVGPRPLLLKYLPYYTEDEKHRHDVRSGLTGLAQVSGRNLIDWDQRFAYDLKYIENMSFLMDMKIILQTALKVLKRSNILVRGEGVNVDFDLYRKESGRWHDEGDRK